MPSSLHTVGATLTILYSFIPINELSFQALVWCPGKLYLARTNPYNRTLGPHGPFGKVFLLFVSQGINFHAHGCEL